MNENKTDYLYTALFCEENIWHLAQEFSVNGIEMDAMTILLLSNPLQQIIVYNQASSAEDEAVIWDYHVILQLERNNQQWIYDFDSRLNFPTPKELYFSESFPETEDLREEYQMFIRYIPASSYLQRFNSDRSHMQNMISTEKFPYYPPILANNPITLAQYRDMSLNLDDGSEVKNY